MPKGLSNWSYKNIIEFLTENGFEFHEERKGSHEAWINPNTQKIVEINYHGKNGTYSERTLETMIRQSGLDKKVWRKWTQS